jgi:hypothetical protein
MATLSITVRLPVAVRICPIGPIRPILDRAD